MSEEQKASGKKKLAQAMLDAAIENINEDIKGIYDSIEKIINDLPKEAEKQVADLKEGIASLEAGLKAVPEQFDIDFSRKMNRILDVVSEIELHTKKLNQTIQSDNSIKIEEQAEIYANQFNNKINEYTITSFWTLGLWGLSCGILGGGISGLLVWVVFPKVF